MENDMKTSYLLTERTNKTSFSEATTVTSSEFKKHYGVFFDTALKGPVIIQKHHRNSLVMVAYDFFEKMQERILELEDYKLVQEMKEIKKNGQFLSGKKAIDKLTSLINK